MKKIKLASLFLFGMMAFVCEKSLAQSQQNQGQQTTNQTDPNVSTPENPDATQTQSTDPNASTEPNKVTIDSTSTGTSTDYGSTTGTTGTTRSESTTKIHIYSGKHDGNNVINPDPKN